jgi:hypothetical protein
MIGLVYEATSPGLSKAVSPLDARSSNCRCIVGYLGGVCANAVVCGNDTITKADLTQSSYCREHHSKFYRAPGSASDTRRWERRVLSAPSSRDGRRA